MFICEECAKEHLQPNKVEFAFMLHRSRGPCEFCRKVAVCADVWSGAGSNWWKPKEEVDPDVAVQAT